MSHFKVIVIGEDIATKLQPWHEFECTGVNDKYIQEVNTTEETLKQYESVKEDYANLREFISEELEMSIVEPNEELDLDSDHKYNYAIMDGSNLVKTIRRTNPNSKWDWWQIGGRYSNQIVTKDGSVVNSARKKDIDIAETKRKFCVPWLANYDKYHAIAQLFVKNENEFKTWESLEAINNIEERRKIYCDQWQHKAFENALPQYWDIDEDIITKQRDEFIAITESMVLAGFAMVYKGEWLYKGTMGWWGFNDATEDSTISYRKKANEIIESLDGEELITIVDCHI